MERSPEVVGLGIVRLGPDGFVVELAAGTSLAVGQTVTGARADAMARALEVPTLVATPVMAEGGRKTLGFALGPPAAPPGTVVYRESVVVPNMPSATRRLGTVLRPHRVAVRLIPTRPHPTRHHQRPCRTGAARSRSLEAPFVRRRQPVAALGRGASSPWSARWPPGCR